MPNEEAIEGESLDVSGTEQEASVEDATVAEESQETYLSPREQKMRDVIAKRNEVLESEMDDHRAVGNLPPSEEAKESEEISMEAEPPVEESLEAALDDSSISEAEQPSTRTLKVNGQLVTLTEAQYEAALQKDLSGDFKLQQANDREQKLAQWEQQLKAQQERLQQQPEQMPPDEGVSKAAGEAARKAIDELIQGNTDEAVENLTAAIAQAGNTQPRIDVDALKDSIKSEVRDEAHQEQVLSEHQKGWNKFSSAEEYQGVVNDPGLLAYADVQLAAVRADPEYRDASPYDQYKRAGDLTLEAFGNEPKEIKPKLNSDRKGRKEKLKPIPKGKGDVIRKAVEEPVIDMSPSAKIQRMRQSRARG